MKMSCVICEHKGPNIPQAISCMNWMSDYSQELATLSTILVTHSTQPKDLVVANNHIFLCHFLFPRVSFVIVCHILDFTTWNVAKL